MCASIKQRSTGMQTERLSTLPAVLTSFAYRPQYASVLSDMLAIARKYHPSWSVIAGRGPVDGEEGSLAVEVPGGYARWNLPIALCLDESENDWRKITMMKGWWLHQVWKMCNPVSNSQTQRVVWMDADSRLNRALDFEIDANRDIVAGPWWDSVEEEFPIRSPYSTITSGMLVFQGSHTGSTERLLAHWSRACLEQIQNLSAPTVPWLNGDQEILTDSIAHCVRSGGGPQILKLNYRRFCGLVGPGSESPTEAVVDHWVMSRKMKLRETREMIWPPAAGTSFDPES
jgi:hypothetical protein